MGLCAVLCARVRLHDASLNPKPPEYVKHNATTRVFWVRGVDGPGMIASQRRQSGTPSRTTADATYANKICNAGLSVAPPPRGLFSATLSGRQFHAVMQTRLSRVTQQARGCCAFAPSAETNLLTDRETPCPKMKYESIRLTQARTKVKLLGTLQVIRQLLFCAQKRALMSTTAKAGVLKLIMRHN